MKEKVSALSECMIERYSRDENFMEYYIKSRMDKNHELRPHYSCAC